MDLQKSENKKLNDAVLEGVQIMCQVFWGPDLESCRHMMEGDFFHSLESVFIRSEEKSSTILDNINSIIKKFDNDQSFYNHFAVELEYLFFLLQQGDELISSEAASFAGKIMLPWVTIFKQRLKSVEDDCRFYSFASGILILFLELISNPK